MRIIVFFDLPTNTDEDKREYRRFRKLLIKNGFFMMQESVYTRMVLNQTVQQSVINTLKQNKPKKGLVQAVSLTEKQFANCVHISGSYKSDIVDTDERLLFL